MNEKNRQSIFHGQQTNEHSEAAVAKRVLIIAEDINNPGHFYPVQGQFNSNGNFELLTAGSGGTTPTVTDGLWDSATSNWDGTDINWDQT